MQFCNPLLALIQKPKLLRCYTLNLGSIFVPFYFSAAEGDDLSCQVGEQFNNGSTIIFQGSQKHPGPGLQSAAVFLPFVSGSAKVMI